MKITLKLAATIFAALSVVLFFNLYVGIDLQSTATEEDAARDQMAMASAIATAVGSVWDTHGESQALAVVEKANQKNRRVEIRWVELDGPATPVTAAMLDHQEYITNIEIDADGDRIMSSYVSVALDGRTRGAIQIQEALIDERRFVSRFSVATAITGVVMMFVSGLIAVGLGRRWIAVPIRSLMEMTRRVAQGDFSARATARGTGELAELARAMDGMAQELEGAIEQLRHADRLNTVGKLSSGVAHELGTPLHVTLGRAKAICADEEAPEHIRDNAATIVRQGDRMSHIIRQLLSFAHAKNLKKRTTNLLGVMDEAVAMVRPIAAKHKVEIRFQHGIDIPIVDIDPTQMQQVITNLLLNAIHASKPDGVVTLGAENMSAPPRGTNHGDSTEYVVCAVEDHGEGIGEDQLSNVFEPFFTTKEVGEGTGLGLSVALGIVREHGGWIDIATEKGSGSRFSVFLPAR